jgi:hypothetical protein
MAVERRHVDRAQVRVRAHLVDVRPACGQGANEHVVGFLVVPGRLDQEGEGEDERAERDEPAPLRTDHA